MIKFTGRYNFAVCAQFYFVLKQYILANSQMRHLTEEIDDLKKLRDNYEAELDNATSRLRSLETEYGQIQLDRNNTRGQLEIALKDNDLLKVIF